MVSVTVRGALGGVGVGGARFRGGRAVTEVPHVGSNRAGARVQEGHEHTATDLRHRRYESGDRRLELGEVEDEGGVGEHVGLLAKVLTVADEELIADELDGSGVYGVRSKDQAGTALSVLIDTRINFSWFPTMKRLSWSENTIP